MIGRLTGVLAARRAGDAVVDVGGVGYRVVTPPNAKLPPIGEDIAVDVHTHVREDSITLYGFPTEGARDLFELLLSCPGVGPKVALACLSVLAEDALIAAVRRSDISALTLVPGIGKRSAEKLIFELAPKVGADATFEVADGVFAEVRDALASLGYGDAEVSRVLGELDGVGAGDADASELLRRALQVLGGARAVSAPGE